jgi:hypothetical protein
MQCHLVAGMNGGSSLWSSTLAQRSATAHGARGGSKLVGAAVARATRWLGAVTQSSSPRLLAGASIVEAHRLDGACMELDGAPWRQCRKASGYSGEGRKRAGTGSRGHDAGKAGSEEVRWRMTSGS